MFCRVVGEVEKSGVTPTGLKQAIAAPGVSAARPNCSASNCPADLLPLAPGSQKRSIVIRAPGMLPTCRTRSLTLSPNAGADAPVCTNCEYVRNCGSELGVVGKTRCV